MRGGADTMHAGVAGGGASGRLSVLQGAGQLSAVLIIGQGREGHDGGHVSRHGFPSPLPGPAGWHHAAATAIVEAASACLLGVAASGAHAWGMRS